MNLQNKRIVMLLVGILLFFGGVGVWLFSYNKIENGVRYVEVIPCSGQTFTPCSYVSAPILLPDKSEYSGIISSSTIKGYKTYTNKRHGFQFSYPEGWRADRSDSISTNFNSLENYSDSLTFKNYSKSEEEETEFRGNDGKNKIDFSVGVKNQQSTSTDNYIEEEEEPVLKQMIVAGQSATKVEFERRKGYGLYLSYSIPILNSNNRLGFIMYGDPARFNQLDELVKTIKWLPVEKK